jgi:hypothetical protein
MANLYQVKFGEPFSIRSGGDLMQMITISMKSGGGPPAQLEPIHVVANDYETALAKTNLYLEERRQNFNAEFDGGSSDSEEFNPLDIFDKDGGIDPNYMKFLSGEGQSKGKGKASDAGREKMMNDMFKIQSIDLVSEHVVL